MECKKLPETVSLFYDNYEYVRKQDSSVKLVASCKKCSRKISANWIPQRVTSNFISHLKVCTREYSIICANLLPKNRIVTVSFLQSPDSKSKIMAPVANEFPTKRFFDFILDFIFRIVIYLFSFRGVYLLGKWGPSTQGLGVERRRREDRGVQDAAREGWMGGAENFQFFKYGNGAFGWILELLIQN
jgi:hypothetical protein